MITLFCPNCTSYLGCSYPRCTCGWQRPAEDELDCHALAWDAPANLGGIPRGQPVIAGELILFAWEDQARRGGLTALQRADGKVRWQIALDYPVRGVAAAGDFVYFATSGLMQKGAKLYCCKLDTQKSSGEVLWEQPLPGGVWDRPIIDEVRVYAACDNGCIVCLDARSGQSVPHWPVCLERGQAWLNPLRGGLVVTTKSGKIYKINLPHGDHRAPFSLGQEVNSRPTIDGEMLYASCAGGIVQSMDLRSGRASKIAQELKQVVASPLIERNRLWIGAHDHHLHAFDLESKKETWRSQPFAHAISSTAASGRDLLVFGVNDGKICAMQAGSGEPFWEYLTSTGRPVTGLAIYANDVFYIADYNGQVFALNWHLGQYARAAKHLEMEGHASEAIYYYLMAAETEGQSRERKKGYYQHALHLMQANGRLVWKARLREALPGELPKSVAEDLEQAGEVELDAKQGSILLHRAADWYEQAEFHLLAEACHKKAIQRARAPYLAISMVEIPQNCPANEETYVGFQVKNLGGSTASKIHLRVKGNIKPPYDMELNEDFPAHSAPLHFDMPVIPVFSGTLIIEVTFSDERNHIWNTRRSFSFNVAAFDGLEINDDVGSLILKELPKRIKINGMVGMVKVHGDAANAS